MKIEITQKEYNKELHFSLDTGATVDKLEQEIVIECVAQLKEPYQKRRLLREVAREIKQMLESRDAKNSK
ncbi:MAG: hypothetical protein KKB34_04950 [Bacteroidetes bacterium]|nr:hypothetical protein [Bacteroidota bacterium]